MIDENRPDFWHRRTGCSDESVRAFCFPLYGHARKEGIGLITPFPEKQQMIAEIGFPFGTPLSQLNLGNKCPRSQFALAIMRSGNASTEISRR